MQKNLCLSIKTNFWGPNLLKFVRKVSSFNDEKPLELIPIAQNYDWGKLGMDSYVARIAQLNSDMEIDEKKPYAELWMGDHEKGASKIKGTDSDLRKHLKHRLSFLFKVLSIRKALSIQVHPNKKEAQMLFKLQPEIYKDPNHKPEMAIALSDFEALCGFRHTDKIYKFCKSLPPLEEVLGRSRVNKLKAGGPDNLREVFKKVMTLSPDCAEYCVEKISKENSQVLDEFKILDVFNRLKKEYPKDVGVLCLFFMNYLRLRAGEAIYTKPNQIHAYISGDCIECMAASDNVIRAGLTPKYRDVGLLLKSTNFQHQTEEELKFLPFTMDKYFSIFSPPVEDFAIIHFDFYDEHTQVEIPSCLTGSILIMICGKGAIRHLRHEEIPLMRGSVIYLPESIEPFIVTKNPNQTIEAFIAMPNRFVLPDD